MRCPYCGFPESKVIDSRPTDEAEKIRRRRECLSCAKRFTTYEVVETIPLVVIKKDKTREVFNGEKLLSGMLRACANRPISVEKLEGIVREVEQELQNSLEREIPTSVIGELVMDRLKVIDEVAYIRFASVHRHFSDINSFMNELKEIIKDKQKR